METKLHELMRKINKTSRSVSWGRSNYLYGHPNQGNFPRAEWSAVIFHPDSCRIQESFETINIELLYHCVKEWAIKHGVIEQPVDKAWAELDKVSGDPF